jgi:hypothetical protein
MRRRSGGSRSLRRAVRFAEPSAYTRRGRAQTRATCGAELNARAVRWHRTNAAEIRARAEPSAHPTDTLLPPHPPLQLSELLLGRRVGVATRTLARETVEIRLKLGVVGKTQILVSCTGAPGAGTGR